MRSAISEAVWEEEATSERYPRVGRPKGQTAEATRDRILDAAEALLSESGYDGASIREIATQAGVGLAVVTYHFGSKADLFDAVVRRRSLILNAQRQETLDAALLEAGNGVVPLETLVRGYVAPFINYAREGDVGWRNYAVLMGRLANSPRGTAIIHRYSDDIAQTYIAEFLRAAPEADPAEVVAGFMWLVSAMLFLCASTGRLEALTETFGGRADGRDAADRLVRFFVGGFTEVFGRARAEPNGPGLPHGRRGGG